MKAAFNKATAKDLMTTEVLAAQADWPLNRLAEFLVENDISGAPVVDDTSRLIGHVSLMDLVRHSASGIYQPWKREVSEYSKGAYRYQLEGRYTDDEINMLRVDGDTTMAVADIMNPTVYVVSPDTPTSIMADMMIRGKIHRLIVTDDDKIVGLVSALDLLELIQDE